MKEFVQKVVWFLWISQIVGLSGAQVQMPVNYLPKEYFLPDGTRDPRHLDGPPTSYFNNGAPSSPNINPGHGIVTTTYHLNPRADLSANFNSNNNINNNINNNNINNNNINNNDINYNYRYGTLGLHNLNQGFNINPVHNNHQFGDKIQASSSTINSKRSRRRLKLRRLPKSFRPPKEFIIYSLPEQSFWSSTHEDDPLNAPSDSNNDTGNDLDQDNGGDDDTNDDELFQIKNQTEKGLSNGSPGDGTAASTKNLKKALLGQCMKQCIDALL